jgi:uncharacterized protein YkwD
MATTEIERAKFIRLAFSLLCTCCACGGYVSAEETPSATQIKRANTSSSSSEYPIFIKSGPFEDDRRALMSRILDAQKKRVGIQGYLNAFQSLEWMVEGGESRPSIQAQLKSIDDALNDQLQEQQHHIDLQPRSLSNGAWHALTSPDQPSTEERLDRGTARKYMLKLINRDRAKQRSLPVVLDATATAVGQEHADEMAAYGYLGHWGLDGRKPFQRYTEAGGHDQDAENAAGCRLHHTKIELSKSQFFTKKDLDSCESSFFDEKPPQDGHRLNIIQPDHTAVGIGLTMGDRCLYCTQEFIDRYGYFSAIPHTIKRGEKFILNGKLVKGAHVDSVELRSEDFPKPMSTDEINLTYSYNLPDGEVTEYFQYDDKYHMSVKHVGGRELFSVSIVPQATWKPGLYYVLVWAHGKGPRTLISTRTFLLQ